MTQNFNFADVLALMGLVQSVYLIVYILFRAGHIRNVIVPSMCFTILALSFTADFGVPRLKEWEHAELIRNFLWMSLPAFSALLIGQVADFGRFPTRAYWMTLILPVLAGVVGYGVLHSQDVLMTLGSISGCLAFLALWAGRRSFADLRDDKHTKNERYWLIISFVVMNILIIFSTLLNVSGYIEDTNFILVRDVLGIGMVYLASTSLLRIYPQSVKLVEKVKTEKNLSKDDEEIVSKIKNLLDFDKVYQEANFSRADLARELNISEANVSRIISGHFGKSLPQLINELRIRDSLQLLQQTEAGMPVIAEQVGFASLPTFNRVFKDVMGISPSEYRQTKKEA
jgi:AraC-like DNA-binding protein